jgi:hypothetical protein
LAARIAVEGRNLATSQFSFAAIGERIVQALGPDLRKPAPLSLIERLRAAIGL